MHVYETSKAVVTNKTTGSSLSTAALEADCMPTGGDPANSGFCIVEIPSELEAAEVTGGDDDNEAAVFLTVGPVVEYSTPHAVNIPCQVLP